ncbi:hypothetical protein [Rhodococcus sp. H29-C3]|uniref:hypothetical protein n=1 Tax=Rhodococcus sp. H29-C3 TaxID=3046307 RepID=UPI0024B9CEF6|nr:hypothetical protein [Rhodococcus sp. H29-C3]MDJ0362787.1 hypothetical protein [Rhodococcus sp. H29-C3]
MIVPALVPRGIFSDDEPVLQSVPLIPGAEVPIFGNIVNWTLVAVQKPANLPPSAWDISFAKLVDPVWNLRARELHGHAQPDASRGEGSGAEPESAARSGPFAAGHRPTAGNPGQLGI